MELLNLDEISLTAGLFDQSGKGCQFNCEAQLGVLFADCVALSRDPFFKLADKLQSLLEVVDHLFHQISTEACCKGLVIAIDKVFDGVCGGTIG